MVHYSSAYNYCEGGAKNPLKGTPLKFLVYARNASFACGQGVKNLGKDIMAYVFNPIFAEALYKMLTFLYKV